MSLQRRTQDNRTNLSSDRRELSFVFGETGETFHNTFVFDPSSRAWQWRMDAEHQGRLQPFARVRLTRVAESDR